MVSQHPPSVDQLARSLEDTGLPHPLLVDAARSAISSGDASDVEVRARGIAEKMARNLLTDVINGTGVLLHTNMGRAPVDVSMNSGRYTNLELDLVTGDRGSRQDRVPQLLAKVCGAEAAMVVNNCASAVMLVLAACGNTLLHLLRAPRECFQHGLLLPVLQYVGSCVDFL